MFYKNNYHSLKLDGEVSQSVLVQSGVRQGCPMSPVLFALALDPFINHLSKKLGPGDSLRAYADDMALVLNSVSKISSVASCFQLLQSASALKVNINKTVFVPLYEASLQDARKDIKYTAWGSMEIEIGHSKYLGFQVGPHATAKINFRPVMEKFRKRSLHWLSLKHIGAYFQTFGFNMCQLP